jgi:hypothetical protein
MLLSAAEMARLTHFIRARNIFFTCKQPCLSAADGGNTACLALQGVFVNFLLRQPTSI